MAESETPPVPLARKLGLRPDLRLSLHGPAAALPAVRAELVGASRLVRRGECDVMLCLVRHAVEVERALARLPRLTVAGGLWIGWPRRGAALVSVLDFDTVQRAGLAHGLVDNRICRINDDWTALRFVRRLSERAPRSSAKVAP